MFREKTCNFEKINFLFAKVACHRASAEKKFREKINNFEQIFFSWKINFLRHICLSAEVIVIQRNDMQRHDMSGEVAEGEDQIHVTILLR